MDHTDRIINNLDGNLKNAAAIYAAKVSAGERPQIAAVRGFAAGAAWIIEQLDTLLPALMEAYKQDDDTDARHLESRNTPNAE